jgi:hypothetical protein
VEESTEQLISEENIENITSEEITSVDINILSIDELIARVSLLSENENPYFVSKEVEEIKSIFYSKLKLEKKEEGTSEEMEESNEEIKKDLHPLEIKFKSALGIYRKIKSDFRKKKEKEEQKNLKLKKQIIEDIHILTKEEESIKTTFEKFRELQERWRNTGHVPITETNNLWQSYHHHIELFYDYIKINNDLRDLDFKRNLEEKTVICKKAEALMKEKTLNKMHQQLQELHEHWKNVGPVKRELREDLWEQFQTISKALNKKRNDYFLEKKQQDAKKLDNKNKICSEIDSLTIENINSPKEWQLATNQCSVFEEKWKSLGRLSKENNKIAWNSLRASLNNFYNKKKAFYKQKKEDSKQVLANKLTICEKAEALQTNNDWQETGKKFMQLQTDWKNSGFIPASQSNEIWKRFKKACDTFFKARKLHYKNLDKEKENTLKEKLSVFEELKSFKVTDNSKENIKTLKEFSGKWKNLGHIPRNKIKINDEFFSLLNSKFEDLGLSKKALATERYKNKISSIKGNEKAINNEQQFIREKLNNLQKTIAQYENNMSFFSNGKNTEPLLKQAQKKIDKAKTEIEDLIQKLQLLKKS